VARPAHAASKPAVAWVLERIPELAGTTYQDGAKSREIELAGVLFLTYLADRSNTGNGRVWMTLATMSRETGLSGSHRDRLLRAFRSLGWLRQVGTTRENERGRGTPVYVLDLVPSLRALDEAYVARQAELVTPPGGISRPSPATDGAIYPPIVPPKSPPGGCENGENVNVSGANRENETLYPYPNATDVTPEPPAVPPRTSVGEKRSATDVPGKHLRPDPPRAGRPAPGTPRHLGRHPRERPGAPGTSGARTTRGRTETRRHTRPGGPSR